MKGNEVQSTALSLKYRMENEKDLNDVEKTQITVCLAFYCCEHRAMDAGCGHVHGESLSSLCSI